MSKKCIKKWKKFLNKTYLTYSTDENSLRKPIFNDDGTMKRRYIKTHKLAKFKCKDK